VVQRSVRGQFTAACRWRHLRRLPGGAAPRVPTPEVLGCCDLRRHTRSPAARCSAVTPILLCTLAFLFISLQVGVAAALGVRLAGDINFVSGVRTPLLPGPFPLSQPPVGRPADNLWLEGSSVDHCDVDSGPALCASLRRYLFPPPLLDRSRPNTVYLDSLRIFIPFTRQGVAVEAGIIVPDFRCRI
jgi:hypothetical protein